MRKAAPIQMLCALAVLLTTVMLIGAGCVNEQCEGYKLLTVNKDIARFSLEYPCNWRRTKVETHPDGNSFYLSLSITAPDIEIDDSRPASAVWILFADWPSKETPNASVAMDDSLSTWASISSSFQFAHV